MGRFRPLRPMIALTLTAALTVALTACGGDPASDSGSSGAPGKDALDNANGKVSIEFWHSMKGANAEAVDALVADFAQVHGDKIEVKPVYQGNYDDTIGKYKTAVQQKNTPALIQIYDIGTRFMIDSKQTVPVQSFYEKDGASSDDIEPNIASYYTADNQLRSMPFNSSTPLLYLNKDAFDRAGLDVTKPPTTLDELAEAAKKLTVRDAQGKVTQYGFGAAIYGWLLEQLLATAGEEYCDNSNGRQGLATKVQFDSPSAVKVAQWWADLVKGGWATNTGRKTDDAQAAFKTGTVAIHMESTSVLRGYVDAAKGRFTVATAPFPKLAAASNGGPIIGGASLWINGPGHSAAEQRAAWEFAKFVGTPEEQAKWHVGTGYVPVNRNALQQPTVKDWQARYPQFTTAVDQLHALPPSVASAGCLLGVMPQARKASEDGLEQAILGRKAPEAAMKEAAAGMKPEIGNYNEAVK
jgi:sn-glycerol 3-phosphate transport system substrate-binding protein